MNFYKKVLFLVPICAMLALSTTPVLSAPAVTLTVNSREDFSDISAGDGVCDISTATGSQCSLRAAIEEVNALGSSASPHTILFQIGGAAPFIISPTSALPAITVPVIINGISQPGANCASTSSPADLLIELDGSNAGAFASGLVLDFGSSGSQLGGLVIGNFSNNGIMMLSNSTSVFCSYIGIGPDGVTDMGNGGYGIYTTMNSVTIGGGTDIGLRNVISNNHMGIGVEGGTDVFIRNNFIGTTADGMSARGNNYGIYVSGANNRIGNNTALGGNLISGNIGPGIRINNGQYNHILGNIIGLASDGVTPLPNSGNGIELLGDALGNIIGGSAPGQANRIEYNGNNGITLRIGLGLAPLQNVILGNAISENFALGIDLGDDGVDSNDPGDVDSGVNQHQNYPILQTTSGTPEIAAALDSLANTHYRLDFYRSSQCDLSGYGQGLKYLSETILTTDATGHAELRVDLSALTAIGDSITATATDLDGNTSEFSACAPVIYQISAPFWVFMPISIK